MRSLVLAIIFLGVFSSGSIAGQYKAGALVAEEIYARPTIGQIANSAAYFTISNTAKEADTIISVGADIAKRVEIHTHKKEDGTMMMMKVEDPVVVPAGGKVLFKSGGLHVMLMGLTQKLKAGDSFPLTITFKKNGTLTVKVIVKKPDVKKAMQDHSHH